MGSVWENVVATPECFYVIEITRCATKTGPKKLFGFCCIFLSIQIWKKKKVHSKVRDTEMFMTNIQITFGSRKYSLHTCIHTWIQCHLLVFLCLCIKNQSWLLCDNILICFLSLCVSLTRPRSNPRLWCRWVFPFLSSALTMSVPDLEKKSQQTSSKIVLINFRYFDAIQGSAPEITAALSPVRAKISTNTALFRSSFSSLYSASFSAMPTYRTTYSYRWSLHS